MAVKYSDLPRSKNSMMTALFTCPIWSMSLKRSCIGVICMMIWFYCLLQRWERGWREGGWLVLGFASIEREVEFQAAAVAVLDVDVASVKEDCMFYDGEAQASAAVFAAPPFVDAYKAVEKTREVFVFNPFTCVVEENEELAIGGGFVAAHAHCATVAGVLDGVFYKVAEDGVDQHTVALDNDVVGQVVFDDGVVLLGGKA